MRSAMADRIELRGLTVRGSHGVFAEERRDGQDFVIDITVWVDLATAAASDDLADTLDYGAIAESVAKVVSGEHFALLERLAEWITEVVLTDGRVTSVTVSVRKLRPPVPVDLSTAGVTITRP